MDRTSQLRTILWLRWRLTKNQWSRGGQFSAVITMLVAVASLIIGAGAGIGGLLAGALLMEKASPWKLLGLWDAIIIVFLFFWMIGIISEIQRSETIDIGRMLHLPVSLKEIFFVNYLVSHFTFCIIVFVPGMIGFALGLVVGKGPLMILLVPLLAGVVFMVTAWTYCLRGWLVTLMTNKRRRRAVIAGVTFTFIILCQLPNLFNVFFHTHNRHRSKPDATQSETSEQSQEMKKEEFEKLIKRDDKVKGIIVEVHRFVPFLWVGNGAKALAEGSVIPALLGSAGAFALGALGLRRAYRSTVRFYLGRTAVRKKIKKVVKTKVTVKGVNFLERRLPWIPDESAALALGFFRSLTRSPEIKMMLGTNFIMLLFFASMIVFRRSDKIGADFKPFIATGAVVVTFFGLTQLLFNQFGHDRAGFRALVLSPVQRKYILLGKNLSMLPIVICIGLTMLLLIKFVLGVSFVVFFASCLQLITGFLLLSIAGNMISTYVPYRIAPGSLKPTKTPGVIALLLFFSHMLFPVAMGPLFLPTVVGLLFSKAGWMPAAVVNLLFSAIMLAIVALFYKLSLPGLGRMLQRREKKILDVVTREIE